jgi:hypothetical protein
MLANKNNFDKEYSMELYQIQQEYFNGQIGSINDLKCCTN